MEQQIYDCLKCYQNVLKSKYQENKRSNKQLEVSCINKIISKLVGRGLVNFIHKLYQFWNPHSEISKCQRSNQRTLGKTPAWNNCTSFPMKEIYSITNEYDCNCNRKGEIRNFKIEIISIFFCDSLTLKQNHKPHSAVSRKNFVNDVFIVTTYLVEMLPLFKGILMS